MLVGLIVLGAFYVIIIAALVYMNYFHKGLIVTNKATYEVLISLTLGVSYINDLETEAKTLQGNLAEAIPNMFKYYPSYELSNLQVEVEPRDFELKER